MTAGLAEILGVAQELLWHVWIVFLRIGAIVSVMPAFGEQSVPMRVKLAIALAFSVVVATALPVHAASTSSMVETGTLFATEPLIGLMLGIGLRMLVFALQTAGSMAAQATSLSQILGGAASEPMPAMGHFLVVAGLALAALSGLHVRAAQFMVLTYEIFPVGEFPDGGAAAKWGVQQVAHAFSLAFTLAAPFVIVSLLYNLTLGVINRAMPQLMVAFVGAPVITAGSLILLLLASPLLLSVWLEAVMTYLGDPLGGFR